MMAELLRLPLLAAADVVVARRLAREVADTLGIASLDQTRLATVVSGLARRSLADAGGGEVVYSTAAAPDGTLDLVIAVLDTTPKGAGCVTAVVPPSANAAGDAASRARLEVMREQAGRPDVASHGLRDRLGTDSSSVLRRRLQDVRLHAPTVRADADHPSSDLSALVARQAKEIARMAVAAEQASADRRAANVELQVTNRGVVELVAELSVANESLITSGVEMRQLADQQSALADLGHRAVASQDLASLATGLVGVVRHTLGVDGVALMKFTHGRMGLEVLAHEGCSPTQPMSIALTRSQSRRLCRAGSRAFDPAHDLSDVVLDLPDGGRSSAVVAVHTPAGPWGVLVVSDHNTGGLPGTAITFVEAAVSLLAFSIARKVSDDATRHSASHDELTGLPNRASLLDELGRLLGSDGDDLTTGRDLSERTPSLAVIFIDIDGFKQVNDTLGHAAGDQVLVGVTERLLMRTRPDDVLARLGGDEFVVLCDGGQSAAPRIAARLLSAFDEPFDVEGEEMFLSASAGISMGEPGATPLQVLADADIAMYRAKTIAGTATVEFRPAMRALAESENRLHNEVRRALERGQFRMVYQPIVDLRDGYVRGVEALLRWRHPELGDVPADVAVAAAEHVGMAWDLTRWVASEAAAATQAWNERHTDHGPLRLAVNFTPLLLDDPAHVLDLATLVDGAGLPVDLLDVELTETAFTDPTPDVLASMADLRARGAKLAMDDFGTGHSTLIALAQLPLDVLKIDRSFVSPLVAGGDSLLVSAMTFIARGRGLETIAEGVETESQLVAVIAAGCDHAQGYLFSRPLELEQLDLLAEDESGFADMVLRARATALTTSSQELTAPGVRQAL